jgi:GDP-4-dehydro-6-deoxy-D-mannose reductase
MQVGNLAARRDFTDVRDVVRAYVLALELGELGEVYNIGTGRSWAIADVLANLLDMSTARIIVKTDTDRLRRSDLPDLVCNAARLQARTGWEPRIPWEQTLRDLLDYERARVAEAAKTAAV